MTWKPRDRMTRKAIGNISYHFLLFRVKSPYQVQQNTKYSCTLQTIVLKWKRSRIITLGSLFAILSSQSFSFRMPLQA